MLLAVAVAAFAVAGMALTRAPAPVSPSAASVSAKPSATAAVREPVKTAMALLNKPARQWSMTVIGDSTGNEPGEWVYLLAEEWSERYNRPVTIHNWSIEADNFTSETKIGEGTNAPIHIWNSSASGKDGLYSLAHFNRIAIQRPDLIVISHGHNVPNAQAAAVQVYDIEDHVVGKWPTNQPSLAVILQNPRVDDEAARMDGIITRLRGGWGSTQPSTLIDVYSVFKKSGDVPRLLKDDGFHPNEAGEYLWFETISAVVR